MEVHINHSSYLKFISSYTAVAIAIIECANIVEHQMHLQFPLFKYTLLIIGLAFIPGLIITYKQQKKPERIREKIITKFNKWKKTESQRYLLHRSELLNLPVLKGMKLPPDFNYFIDHSKHDARKKQFIFKLLPVVNVCMILSILGFGIYFFVRMQSNTVTIEKDLPQFLTYIDSNKNQEAFNLGNRLLADNPKNKIVLDALDRITTTVDISSEPSNVKVFRLISGDHDTEEWQLLGNTPLKKVNVPWTHITKLKFQGGNNKEFIFSESTWFLSTRGGTFALPTNLQVDTSMQSIIIGQKMPLFIPGLDEREAYVDPFVIDRYEVTNEDYQKFVIAGGYTKAAYWDFPTTTKKGVVTFFDAMNLFRDKSGISGPASWISGSFPAGKGKLPVNGISWYEASAYARFAGKKLPSVYHWTCASTVYMGSEIIPASNFSKTDVKEVGYGKKSLYGLYDVGGNVREWCTNTSGPDSTFKAILGGSYMDEPYSFNDFFAQDPFDRSLANGVRCMVSLRKDEPVALYNEYLHVPLRDYRKLPKVSKEVFAVIKRQYDYEKKPLNAVVKNKITSNADFDVEIVEFDAAYNSERMSGYLYTGKGGSPPLKTIIYFPGANAFNENIESLLQVPYAARFLVKQNYAVFTPVYKSTYNRKDEVKNDYPNKSDLWKEHIIMWGKDMKRSIDYLETRKDLDISKLAYYGSSWGGAMGNILCAIDDRVKIGILYVAGFYHQQCQLEVEQYVYTPNITIPVIMLNGKYDFFFPLETSQNPMYEMLGTAPQHKKRYVYETGHAVPEENLIKEVLGWLETYTNNTAGLR